MKNGYTEARAKTSTWSDNKTQWTMAGGNRNERCSKNR